MNHEAPNVDMALVKLILDLDLLPLTQPEKTPAFCRFSVESVTPEPWKKKHSKYNV